MSRLQGALFLPPFFLLPLPCQDLPPNPPPQPGARMRPVFIGWLGGLMGSARRPFTAFRRGVLRAPTPLPELTPGWAAASLGERFTFQGLCLPFCPLAEPRAAWVGHRTRRATAWPRGGGRGQQPGLLGAGEGSDRSQTPLLARLLPAGRTVLAVGPALAALGTVPLEVGFPAGRAGVPPARLPALGRHQPRARKGATEGTGAAGAPGPACGWELSLWPPPGPLSGPPGTGIWCEFDARGLGPGGVFGVWCNQCRCGCQAARGCSLAHWVRVWERSLLPAGSHTEQTM